MRVVSQKKDASYDFDRTEFRTSYECISATFDGRTFVIGKYATPERAAEVFMDMHKAICACTGSLHKYGRETSFSISCSITKCTD